MDASTRGRRNRANGADYERKVATYLRAWWPQACRAVRNSVPDPGDIAETSSMLWWSVKNCVTERYPEWFAEMEAKSGGRIAVLVVRRRGHADPGRWWAFLTLADLQSVGFTALPPAVGAEYIRLELRVLLALFAQAGHTPLTPGDPS